MSESDNDNEIPITYGSGNVFLDLGFDEDEAALAILALAEFHAKGGIRFEDFKAELDLRRPQNNAPQTPETQAQSTTSPPLINQV